MKNYAKKQIIGGIDMCSYTIMHIRLQRKLSFQHGKGYILHKQEAGIQILVKMLLNSCSFALNIYYDRARRGRDRIVAGFTTTYAISAYHH